MAIPQPPNTSLSYVPFSLMPLTFWTYFLVFCASDLTPVNKGYRSQMYISLAVIPLIISLTCVNSLFLPLHNRKK